MRAITKVSLGFLVLALHWATLEVLVSRYKTPSRTSQMQQPTLRIQWSDLKTIEAYQKSKNGTLLPTPVKINHSELMQPFNFLAHPDSASTEVRAPNRTETNGVQLGWNSELYRSSPDVDTRAAPTIDWAVNRQAVPNGVYAQLVVTIWISAEGVVDHFELLQQQPSGDWATAVLSSFQTTAIEPATLAGMPVASTMTIELSFDINTQ